MAAAAGNHDSFDRGLADEARFALSPVNTVLELEESRFAVGIHIIRNRRPAQGDRFLQYFLDGEIEFPQLLARDRCSSAPWANPGAKQRFICINIPYATQKFLIQQRALDWGLAAME